MKDQNIGRPGQGGHFVGDIAEAQSRLLEGQGHIDAPHGPAPEPLDQTDETFFVNGKGNIDGVEAERGDPAIVDQGAQGVFDRKADHAGHARRAAEGARCGAALEAISPRRRRKSKSSIRGSPSTVK